VGEALKTEFIIFMKSVVFSTPLGRNLQNESQKVDLTSMRAYICSTPPRRMAQGENREVDTIFIKP
jgi:hypothetical protein